MAVDLAPVDESVHIPQAVREAAARANAYYGQQTAADSAPPVTPVPAPTPVPTIVDGDQPIKIVAVAETPPATPAPSPATLQPPPATPAPPPATLQPPPATPAPAPTAEDWEHRYNSMKGRFDQSQQTLAVMQDQLSETINMNLALQDEVRRIAQGQQQPPQLPAPVVTPEERQTYGDDFLSVVQRVSQAAVLPQINKLSQDNKELRTELHQRAQRTMYSDLEAAVPNWREINTDPGFLSWLSLPDVYAGQIRRGLLNAAFRAAQAPRVIAFFKGYLAEAQATGQIPATRQAAVPTPAEPAVPLVTLAAPGAAIPATGSTVPTDKPIYTHKQISQFYDGVRRGLWAGRETERVALERDMIAAAAEGRVRG